MYQDDDYGYPSDQEVSDYFFDRETDDRPMPSELREPTTASILQLLDEEDTPF